MVILAIALLIGSFALSAVLTATVRKIVVRTDFVARPAADRYHRNIIPLGGGIAIFATIFIVILAAITVVKFLVVPGHFGWLAERAKIDPADFLARIDELLVILLCIVILFVLGLWDDKRHLGPFFKLGVQFAVAFIAAAFAEIRVEFFIENQIIASVLSAFWIVLIINAFNFLDNMDGASAGIAHEYFCRREVKDQKSQQCPDKDKSQPAYEDLSAESRGGKQNGTRDDRDTGRGAVHIIQKVKGIDNQHNPKG